MHARAANTIDTGNGARQLAFNTALVTSIFNKLTGAERLLFIHQLKALGRAGRQTKFSEFKARHVHIIRCHQNCAAALIHLEVNLILFKHIHHVSGIQIIHAAIERTVIIALHPHHNRKTNGNAGRQCHHQSDLAQQIQITEAF